MFRIENRHGSVLLQRQSGLGKDKVKGRHSFLIPGQKLRICACLRAQIGQNDRDLFLLFDLQLPQLVVQINDSRRLDKKGGTGRRLVVHHPLHLPLVLGLDRNTVAVVAHGHHRVLQIRPAGTADHGRQLGMNAVVRDRHAAADLFQGRAGIVGNLLLRQNAPADLIGKRRQRLQTLEILIQRIGRRILPLLAPVTLDAVDVFQKSRDPQQFRDGKRAADLQRPDAHPQILIAAKRRRTLAEQISQRIRRLRLRFLDRLQVRHRL